MHRFLASLNQEPTYAEFCQKTFITVLVAAIVLIGAASAGIHYTSRTQFCLSCHDYEDDLETDGHMKTPAVNLAKQGRDDIP